MLDAAIASSSRYPKVTAAAAAMSFPDPGKLPGGGVGGGGRGKGATSEE